MLGDFTYHNPTQLYFGENALEYLNEELLWHEFVGIYTAWKDQR